MKEKITLFYVIFMLYRLNSSYVVSTLTSNTHIDEEYGLL